MPLYENGPLTQYGSYNAGVIPTDVYGVAINWFVNRTPLATRLPHLPVGSPDFKITNDDYRPRTSSVATALADGSGTSLVVPDATIFDVGDVIKVESEVMLVTAITPSSNTLTVTRAYAGTTGAAHAQNKAVQLITNTRTGAEVDISAMSRVPAIVTQNCQTIQHAYSIGGALQANTNYVSGHGTPLDRDRMLALQHCMDDFESACYYGAGVALTSKTARPGMKGLSSLIVTNNTSSPTNASSYKPADLIRDTVQKCFNGGGNPGLLVVSTDLLTGLATWNSPAVRLNAGATAFGVSIDLFHVPFLSGQVIVPAPLLQPGTVICLSVPEVRIRMKRELRENRWGSRGDAIEGDMIMEGAIELDNETHHAFVTGITGYAAP